MGKPGIADVTTAVGPRAGGHATGTVPALTIVSHPMAGRAGERARLDALLAGHGVALSRNAPDFVRPGHSMGAPISDPFVSRRPVRFLAGPAGGIRIVAPPQGTPAVVNVPVDGELDIGAAEL